MPRRNPPRNNSGGMASHSGVLTLFDIEPTPVGLGNKRATSPERQAQKPPQARTDLNSTPSWSAYSGPHTNCDEGIRLMYENKPQGHLVPALYARTYRGERRLMCTQCARHWRGADGLDSLPSRPAKKPKQRGR
jgi:hypothetical protein